MRKLSIHIVHFSESKGFTLIEILTAISLMAVIGTICVGVITITLKSTKKTDLLEVARQNGDTAMSQMVRTIRYAASLDNPTSCVPSNTVNTISVSSLDTHIQTTYRCTSNNINKDGIPMFNASTLQVSSCQFICRQPTVNDPPSITIQYTLQPPSAGLFSETNFAVPFESSVTMRNVQ